VDKAVSLWVPHEAWSLMSSTVTVMAFFISLPLVKCMVLCVLGPLMVITQKVTSLAFSLHDGLARREDELSADQKYHVVR
jgi:hypothetical protein